MHNLGKGWKYSSQRLFVLILEYVSTQIAGQDWNNTSVAPYQRQHMFCFSYCVLDFMAYNNNKKTVLRQLTFYQCCLFLHYEKCLGQFSLKWNMVKLQFLGWVSNFNFFFKDT